MYRYENTQVYLNVRIQIYLDMYIPVDGGRARVSTDLPALIRVDTDRRWCLISMFVRMFSAYSRRELQNLFSICIYIKHTDLCAYRIWHIGRVSWRAWCNPYQTYICAQRCASVYIVCAYLYILEMLITVQYTYHPNDNDVVYDCNENNWNNRQVHQTIIKAQP
jgi:hypothetical protein